MKIEVLENRLSSDGFSGELGDRFTVPDNIGSKWCALGWAKDLSGSFPTGERKVINAELYVQDVQSSQSVEVK